MSSTTLFQLPIEITNRIIEYVDTVSLHRFSTTCVHIPEYDLSMEMLTNEEWKNRVIYRMNKIYQLIQNRCFSRLLFSIKELIKSELLIGNHNWRKVYLSVLSSENMIKTYVAWRNKMHHEYIGNRTEPFNWEFVVNRSFEREGVILKDFLKIL